MCGENDVRNGFQQGFSEKTFREPIDNQNVLDYNESVTKTFWKSESCPDFEEALNRREMSRTEKW